MPIAFILEKIFIGLLLGGFIALWKAMSALFSIAGQAAEQKLAQQETEKAFGKLDNSIEIYEPAKRDSNADQT